MKGHDDRAPTSLRAVFVDRRKNVIRRSGENIAAVEVEAVLNQHEAVAACGVAPVADEIRGDEVMACVSLTAAAKKLDATELAQDIMKFCQARLAYYKAPGYIAFIDDLPLTATQKMKRGDLKTIATACAAQRRHAQFPDHRAGSCRVAQHRFPPYERAERTARSFPPELWRRVRGP